MKKWYNGVLCLILSLLLFCLAGCGKKEQSAIIGVAFGVGPASRWPQEIKYMENYAEELGISLETRLNTDEEKKPFAEDCLELIDSGINVLIVRPRDVWGMKEVVDYARKHKVKIISYDSLIEEEPIDLFVGYDSEYTGQLLGRHLSELVVSGDYILLWGDMNRNIEDMYRGAMKYLAPLDGQINILLESDVPGWSPEEAKKIVMETVAANNNKIDAIFAFNDKLAGACAEAIEELGIENPVIITGIDAELDAVKRIIEGTQACTAYMDIEELALTAVDCALNLISGETMQINSQIDNGSGAAVPSYLLPRRLVTKQNIDRILIESGYYTYEQVYGTEKTP